MGSRLQYRVLENRGTNSRRTDSEEMELMKKFALIVLSLALAGVALIALG